MESSQQEIAESQPPIEIKTPLTWHELLTEAQKKTAARNLSRSARPLTPAEFERAREIIASTLRELGRSDLQTEIELQAFIVDGTLMLPVEYPLHQKRPEAHRSPNEWFGTMMGHLAINDGAINVRVACEEEWKRRRNEHESQQIELMREDHARRFEREEAARKEDQRVRELEAKRAHRDNENFYRLDVTQHALLVAANGLAADSSERKALLALLGAYGRSTGEAWELADDLAVLARKLPTMLRRA
jgi:hypothetical protein